jgi:hypothetical protein
VIRSKPSVAIPTPDARFDTDWVYFRPILFKLFAENVTLRITGLFGLQRLYRC